jgi:phosphoribosyl 1,2-cyclic phosphate phosphodiesterase
MRIVEEITAEWSNKSPFVFKNHSKPIIIYAPEKILDEIRNIKSPLGSYLDFFEHKDFVKTVKLDFDKNIRFGGIFVRPVKLVGMEKTSVCAYLFKEGDKKLIYMPCDVKPFKEKDVFRDLDIFMVNSPFFKPLNKGQEVPENHPLRKGLFSMDELIQLIEKYSIKKTIIVHIEEMWGRSFDDYKKIEKKYKKYNLKFAYDGMKIKI